MRSKIALAVLWAGLLASLAACASPEEIHAQDEAACASFGFQQGTPDFAACMQRESLARRYGPWYGPPPFPPGWYDGHRFWW